jgi:phage baseplate assembly protein W
MTTTKINRADNLTTYVELKSDYRAYAKKQITETLRMRDVLQTPEGERKERRRHEK